MGLTVIQMNNTITTATIVIEGHTMKHTIKRDNGAPVRTLRTTKKMIGLRLPDEEMALVERLATEDERSVSQFARICLRLGIEEFLARRTAEG